MLLMKRTFGGLIALFGSVLILAGLVLHGTALAQLTSDEVPHIRTVPAAEAINNDIDRSLYHLGPIRLLPMIRLEDFGYDSNVFGAAEDENPVSDVTATVIAGGKAILPVGRKVYFQANLLPQYQWFDKLADRRTFGGFYEGSVFLLFNRVSFEGDGSYKHSLSYFSAESPEKVLETVTDGKGALEVNITGPLFVFAGAEGERLRFEPPQGSVDVNDVGSLNRDEKAGRAGVRYVFSQHFNISAAVEGTRTEFVETPEFRDNQSAAYLIGFHYDRPRFFLNMSVGYRQGKSFNGSLFPDYGTVTGSYFISFFATPWLEIQPYGHRNIDYGLAVDSPYFFDTRNGGAVNLRVHRRVELRGYGETGTNDYAFPVVGGEPQRLDHVTDYGGGISVLISKKIVISAIASRVNYTSNIPGLDRTVTRFTTGLSFEGEFFR